MVNQLTHIVRSKHCFDHSSKKSHFFFSSIPPNKDHSRRLIQAAYACFQQLNECSDLNGEQKQWIQTWMDAVSNVSDPFERLK